MQRYLVITELFLPTKGGTAVWFDEVYRRIGDRHTHIVTAAVPGDALHDSAHPNSVHRLYLQRISWLKPESLAMYLKLFGRSLWLALTRRFTAVHAGRALPEGLVAWLVGRLTFHPVLIYAHGEELTTWGAGGKFRAMRFVLRHADIVIANSDYTRAELLKLGVKGARIVLINPGVDIERFQPDLGHADLHAQLGIGEHQRLLLSVGRLSRRKGFDAVIKSLPDLMRKGFDVQYAVIGIGEDEQYLAELAQTSGLESRVHLLGHVSTADLPRWYNACDIFLMPNRDIDGDTEGFGMVFLEAAACGKPAIAGMAGGTGAAVIHEETGLRVDGNSMSQIIDAIASLLRDRSKAREMGDVGCGRARAKFAWSVVAERVENAGNGPPTESRERGER